MGHEYFTAILNEFIRIDFKTFWSCYNGGYEHNIYDPGDKEQ